MRSSGPRPIRAPRRRGNSGARASFAANDGPRRTAPIALRRAFQATTTALRRTTAALIRTERTHTRFDTRTGMQTRRARTRRLIELGGLVQKCGLADQLAGDRAAIMGALLTAVRLLNNISPHLSPAEFPAEVIARWREAGRVALNRRDQLNTETL